MNHKAIKITLKGSSLQIDFAAKDAKDIAALVKQVKKSNGTIPPEFVIEILARSLLASKSGVETDDQGTVKNW
jgi:hypothetical protein